VQETLVLKHVIMESGETTPVIPIMELVRNYAMALMMTVTEVQMRDVPVLRERLRFAELKLVRVLREFSIAAVMEHGESAQGVCSQLKNYAIRLMMIVMEILIMVLETVLHLETVSQTGTALDGVLAWRVEK